MKLSANPSRGIVGLFALAMIALLGGCRSEYGGHRPTYEEIMNGDVQYYAPGPEFKLANETAATRAYAEEQAAAQANEDGQVASEKTER